MWSLRTSLRGLLTAVYATFIIAPSVQAVQLDLSSTDSIKQAAGTVAEELLTYYTGDRPGDVPGNLPDPYYWWQCGAMFGALVDYWHYTGDDQYNDRVIQGLQHQVGPKNDYMPPNVSRQLGNDDQGFWGMTVMSAAELNFPNPPDDKPQWLALAQAVFNSQAARWDDSTCGGGLRWQIFTYNNGYNYKNTISNGCFFNIAARLAKYTRNDTYAEWAERAWDWQERIGLITPTLQFFDGTDVAINCSDLNRIQWSYNTGVHLLGAAMLWNYTESDVWRDRTQRILDGTSVFFSPEVPDVMYEVACEPNNLCDRDQKGYKGFLSRWMAATSKVAPWTADFILPKLAASAQAAAAQCSGGPDGKVCGLKWTMGETWDGITELGAQMAALEVIQSNLINQVTGPVTDDTGGTSRGDPAAGTDSAGAEPPRLDTVTTADRAGAGILTTIVLISIIGGGWWMVT